MTSTIRQNDIYHARLVKVIGVTPGQNSKQVCGQSRTISQPQDECTDICSNDINQHQQLDISSQKIKMGSDGEKTPPLPPRGSKPTSTSMQQRLNIQSGNRNFLTKYFEQNSYANGKKNDFLNDQNKPHRGILKKNDTGVVKKIETVTIDNSGRTTPPPKLPPRIPTRPVTQPSVQETLIQKSGKTLPAEKRNGEIDPQPLTRINITKHDKIWNKDQKDEKTVNGVLSPPLNHITPETAEELWDKFDPLDVLDSTSEHSDSSADTMIMMTTEEEEKNQSKISQSMQKFEKRNQNIPSYPKIDFKTSSNVILEEREEKSVKISQLSPKSEDTDDGYGTNSSQGTTVSSPLSSSLTSLVIPEVDSSQNQGSFKRAMATSSTQQESSAITNPAKTTWAVRRRAKMTEAKENASSLQEQLRQLAIIEEEENTHENNEAKNQRLRQNSGVCRRFSEKGYPKNSSLEESQSHDIEDSDPLTSDLQKFEGELYDKLIDMDRNYRNYYGFDKDFDVKKEDSKVLYFQQKVLKQNYGSDNYYNPRGYYGTESRDDIDRSDISLSTVGSLPRDMGHSRDYRTRENSSYRSGSSGISSNEDHFNQTFDCVPIPGNVSLPGMPNKGQFSSAENINNQNGRRPLFASSADIHKLFQTRDNIGDQLQRPASCRHSFHAMPCTQQWIVDAQNQADVNVPRQRAASASATTKSRSSSWNPFGLFNKKKNKSGGSNQDIANKNKSNTENKNQIQKPIIKAAPSVTPTQNGTLKRYAEKSGIETLPNGNVYDAPFRTVKHVAPSGTKLSTLV